MAIKKTVSIKFEAPEGVGDDVVGLTIRDALSEFFLKRENATMYVAKRYEDNPNLCTNEKVLEVRKRCELVVAMQSGKFTIDSPTDD